MGTFFQIKNEAIRVTARGQWLHGADPITKRIADLFAKHVVVQDDGSYAIRLGKQQQVIKVDDTPFSVTQVHEHSRNEEQIESLTLHTSDGRQEELDPKTLMQSEDNVLYCRVLRDGFLVPCRFEAGQYHNLALMAEQENDHFYLPLHGQKYAIKRYDGRPIKAN